MQKILTRFFAAANALFRGPIVPHDDTLRAGQFEDRAPFRVYRALIGTYDEA